MNAFHYAIARGPGKATADFARIVLWVAMAGTAWEGDRSLGAAETKRPNVVVFLADDQGWGDLSVHGNTNLATPHIDSLARDGALFERFFVCPLCSPTRAEFLTARYHFRGGVRGVSVGQERLDLDERTIAQVFREAGYATGAFGKWHNGTQHPYHPNARGFDEFYGFTSGHWGDYFDAELDHNGEPVHGEGFLADDIVSQAIQFIDAQRERPFFCYVTFNTPHSPMQVPDEFWQRFADKELTLRARDPSREDVPKTRAALAMCENIDWNVGRVLDRLDERRLAEQTIVVYFSDNGPNGDRWNGDMKGQKGSLDEGGVRSPLLIRYPGRIKPATRVARIAGAIDLGPTLAELAAIEWNGPASNLKPLDGRSLVPLLTGDAANWPDRMHFNAWSGQLSVRNDRFRLDPAGALYDLTADPGQRRDVASEHPDLAATMAEAARRMAHDVKSETDSANRPFTVGYAARTSLPARDGVPHGQIRRSAGAPNCSFFTHWTSLDDRITWEVEVGRTGRYDVEVLYTCPGRDVGSTVELSCGGGRVEGRVTEPHNPPLRGVEHDRTPRRGESLVKEFRPLPLGRLELAAGPGTLTLRAVSMPGRQVMDVREIVLRRIE